MVYSERISKEIPDGWYVDSIGNIAKIILVHLLTYPKFLTIGRDAMGKNI